MKHSIKNFICALMVIVCVFSVLSVTTLAASDESIVDPSYESYTYWTELSGATSKKAVRIKPMYQLGNVIESTDLGFNTSSILSDVCASPNGSIYILESEKPQIIVLNGDYQYVKAIYEIKNEEGKSVSFKGSKGIFVTEKEEIYICGTSAACVWKVNSEGVIQKTLYLPDSEIIPDGFKYSPIKVTVDSKGYVYVLSDGSYYGAIVYSPEGKFLGFYGANTVTSSAMQVINNIWNKLFVNDVKKSASVKSLPYQFTDFDIGVNDFIYTTTGRTSGNSTGQVQILNPSGKDILGNGSFDFDDTETAKIGKTGWIPQDTSQIAADGEYFFLLDSGYCKVFLYDVKGNLLGVFGGSMGKTTSQKDALLQPVAITCNRDDVVILDNGKKNLVIYSITEYGKLVRECQSLTLESKYNDAAAGWEAVLSQDKNSQLAYRGLARAALRNGDYKKAMELAEIGAARDVYSEAYTSFRTRWIKDNSVLIFTILLLFVAIVVAVFVVLKKKKISLAGNNSISHCYYVCLHPFDGFAQVLEKGSGSVTIGSVIVLLLYISSVLKSTQSGFAYGYFNTYSYNALFDLVKTVGIVVLWTLVNWAVGALFGGLGKIRNIYIVITYSIIPLVISNVLYTILSNVLISSETGFLSIMVTIFWIYTIFLLVAGTIKIQDFDFGKFVFTSFLTIVGILIVIFIAFCVFLLMQQCVMFFGTLINEVIYR